MYQMTILLQLKENLPVEGRERFLKDLEEENERDLISGCIMLRHDIAIQLLEGNRGALKKRYKSLALQKSVVQSIKLIWEGLAGIRFFSSWHSIDYPMGDNHAEDRHFINNIKILTELVANTTACTTLFWSRVRNLFQEDQRKLWLNMETL